MRSKPDSPRVDHTRRPLWGRSRGLVAWDSWGTCQEEKGRNPPLINVALFWSFSRFQGCVQFVVMIGWPLSYPQEKRLVWWPHAQCASKNMLRIWGNVQNLWRQSNLSNWPQGRGKSHQEKLGTFVIQKMNLVSLTLTFTLTGDCSKDEDTQRRTETTKRRTKQNRNTRKMTTTPFCA